LPLNPNVSLKRSARALDAYVALDGPRSALNPDIAFNRPSTRPSDRRISLDDLRCRPRIDCCDTNHCDEKTCVPASHGTYPRGPSPFARSTERLDDEFSHPSAPDCLGVSSFWEVQLAPGDDR
jgi:hypothetical protein